MAELFSNTFLKWGNHHEALVSLLDNLLEREELVDVTLAAEGQFINVHKLVLFASSKYFEDLLSQSHKPSVIYLNNVKFSDLKSLIDYMYKGEVNLPQDQLVSFLETAKSLKIKGLPYDGENLDMLMNFADLSEKQSHQDTFEVYMMNHIKEEDEESLESTVEPPQVLIVPDHLDILDEDIIIPQKNFDQQNQANQGAENWADDDGEYEEVDVDSISYSSEDEWNPNGISGPNTTQSSMNVSKLRPDYTDDYKNNKSSKNKNSKEQHRRAELSNAFHSLRSLIPGLETKDRAAQLTILDKGSHYCQSLTADGELYEINIAALKNEQKKLRERIALLLQRKT